MRTRVTCGHGARSAKVRAIVRQGHPDFYESLLRRADSPIDFQHLYVYCDRFEAMLTEPDTMGIVSEAEEHGIGAELRSARELIEGLLIP